MPEHHLSLAVNGREHQLHHKLVPFEMPAGPWGDAKDAGDDDRGRNLAQVRSVAIVGLGYVGLPTALALHGKCPKIIGIDTSQQRLVSGTLQTLLDGRSQDEAAHD